MPELKFDEGSETITFTIAVLLATFYPNLDFLDQQIKSILGQVGVKVNLYWADDSGIKIEYLRVKRVFDKYEHIDVTSHWENKGANLNFLHLLQSSDSAENDYYAFSDQDDIWESDKLLRHAIALSQYGAKVACTHSLAIIQKNGIQFPGKNLCQKHELDTLLEENCFQGCTMMINRPTRDLVLSLSPEGIAWYDWWIGSIVSIVGSAHFVEGTDTTYRLHGGNLIGIPTKFSRLKKLITTSREDRLSQSRNLLSFARTYGHLSAAEVIQNWINGHTGNVASRLKFAFFDRRRRKRVFEDVVRRVFAIQGMRQKC